MFETLQIGNIRVILLSVFLSYCIQTVSQTGMFKQSVNSRRAFKQGKISGACLRWLRPVSAWSAIILGAVGIALILFLAANAWEHHRQEFPRNLGNARAARLLASRETGGNSTKFAVIGDIHNGTETFEAVAAHLREEQNVAFLVLLGDCADDPMRNLHIHFINEFAETGLSLPTFIVAGNHDVAPGKFGYPEFEGLYGPANFAFTYHGNLFIGLGGLLEQTKLIETLSFLEKTLREKRSSVKKVFVFMHYSPAPPDYVIAGWQDAMKKFQNLFERYKVSYVFSGHHHRLVHTNINGVVYLISGGGGAFLRNDRFRGVGLFHHLTVIETSENEIAEHIIPVAPAGGFSMVMDRIESVGLTTLLPWSWRHPMLSIAAIIIFIGMLLWGAVDRRRQRALSKAQKTYG
jgi:predicted phosphodiesterase